MLLVLLLIPLAPMQHSVIMLPAGVGSHAAFGADESAIQSNDDDDDDDENDFYDVSDPEYYNNLTKFKYILYYGGFTDEIAESILSVNATLLVTNYYAIDHDMREEFAENNVTVIAYLPIKWTDRDLDSTLSEARQLLEDGADGIFVDEATTISNDWELWYHRQIYDAVKDYDEDNIVIINPGSAAISENAMLVADIICFEHEWRNIENLDWATKYPGWRFMGISSNEFVKVMGYHVDSQSAESDLEEARNLNIAYHYSADHYIWLPPWLDVYDGIAGSPHPVTEYSSLDIEEPANRPDRQNPAIEETDEIDDENNDTDVIVEAPDDAGSGNDDNNDSNSGEEGEGAESGEEETEEEPEQPETNDDGGGGEEGAEEGGGEEETEIPEEREEGEVAEEGESSDIKDQSGDDESSEQADEEGGENDDDGHAGDSNETIEDNPDDTSDKAGEEDTEATETEEEGDEEQNDDSSNEGTDDVNDDEEELDTGEEEDDGQQLQSGDISLSASQNASSTSNSNSTHGQE